MNRRNFILLALFCLCGLFAWSSRYFVARWGAAKVLQLFEYERRIRVLYRLHQISMEYAHEQILWSVQKRQKYYRIPGVTEKVFELI